VLGAKMQMGTMHRKHSEGPNASFQDDRRLLSIANGVSPSYNGLS